MASTNTLTGLIPDIYAAVDVISQEMRGMIPSVTIDSSVESVAKDQVVRSPIAGAASPVDSTPAQQAPDTGGDTITYVDMAITKERAVPVAINGNEQKGLGSKSANIQRDRFVQAMRALTNEIESDLCTEAYQNSSRGFGTAGTTPFASDLSAAAQLKKILDDNGADGKMGNDGMRSLIIDSTAGVNLRTLSNLMTSNQAGTDATLRQGTLLPIVGFDIKESAGIVSHTKGAGTGYLINGAEAIGQTTLTLDTGTVNVTGITAGDIVTIAGDTNKYAVNTGLVAVAGDITIGSPGLISAAADNAALTIGSSYTANIGFSRSAIQLLTRSIAIPSEGDLADDRVYVTDPLTGLTFAIAMYKQYRQVHYEVSIAWGVKAVKPAHIATLIG